ncbi:MAG TPA: glutamate-1-semialdehyde 2,1-aminomutase, partial [Polyangiales bacterium]|nr:glutamate-1-semialdehyde 2,1-aminomutase [Polyangiales bacterium]
RAQRVLPGGVNSPVRAFKAVGGHPVFIREARGPYLYGADGAEYVDYVGSWGPMILGHAEPAVIQSIARTAALGTSYGAPTEGEVKFAETLIDAVPSMEMVRCVSSGTEAVMGALRVARGFTGRDLIVKMEGGFHGGADYLLVKAGSGLATLGVPDSAGIPLDVAKVTLTMPYNDLAAATTLFQEHGPRIAAIIVEPVAGNMGCVPPEPGYLEGLKTIAQQHGALLVFDEVMTGFRVAYGGAQARFGVTPDITTLAKVIGGGMPLGAYGARREIMSKIAPVGPVYQAGTLSGNPVAVQAGLTTLEKLRRPGVYEQLEQAGARLEKAFEEGAKKYDVALTVQRVGSMLTPFFTGGPVRSWDEASRCDTAAFGRFHQALIAQQIYWPPSQFEAGFISTTHDEVTFQRLERALDSAFKNV